MVDVVRRQLVKRQATLVGAEGFEPLAARAFMQFRPCFMAMNGLVET